MPDEDGYILPGELGGGAWGAFEGDLGFKVRPLAGFGRDLPSAEPSGWDGTVFFTPEGFQSSVGVVVFEVSRSEWGLYG